MGGGKKQEAQAQAAQQQAYEAGVQDAMAQQAAADAGGRAASRCPAGASRQHLDQQLVEIQKLSVMKDQGLLTEEEFSAKKAQILGL